MHTIAELILFSCSESKEFHHIDKSHVIPLALGATEQALARFGPHVV